MSTKSELSEIVGEKFVLDDEKNLEAFSKDFSLIPHRMPSYVVQPGSAREVSEVVKLANEEKMPVIPASSGVHFYGSTVPSQGGIILDLGRMDKILDINGTDRLVRIEPGVSWEKLQSEMAKLGHTCIIPLLPHSSKSVLTTWLEREVPVNSRYEFAEPLTTMEVVWPNGDIFRTGSASTPGMPNSVAKGGNPQGPGLDWYRLLQGAQGTMGVVTWGIIKFEHLPEVNKTFFFPFEKVEDAIEPTYKIQRRMLGNECLLLNKLNLATILAEDWTQDFEPLMKILPNWMLILVLSGAPRRPEEKIEYEEKALREICLQFPEIEPLAGIPGIPGVERELPQMLRQPWNKNAPYWKHRLKGGSEDLFFIAKLSKVPEFVQEMNKIAIKYEFPLNEIGCYIQPIEQGRACHCEFNFYLNPEDSEEVERVHNLYLEVSKSLLNLGAHFSRPYGVLAEIVYERATGYTTLLKKVKNLFDPNNVMNPGKLCF